MCSSSIFCAATRTLDKDTVRFFSLIFISLEPKNLHNENRTQWVRDGGTVIKKMKCND